MKKNYEAPFLEITKFEVEDVLNSSVIEGSAAETIRPGPVGGLGPKNPT